MIKPDYDPAQTFHSPQKISDIPENSDAASEPCETENAVLLSGSKDTEYASPLAGLDFGILFGEPQGDDAEKAQEFPSLKFTAEGGSVTLYPEIYLDLSTELEPIVLAEGGPVEIEGERILTNLKKEEYKNMGLEDMLHDAYGRPHDCDGHHDNCSKVAHQNAEIDVPIEITPNMEIGNIDVSCKGEPVICCDHKSCAGSLSMKIKQKLCIKIPIKYTFSGRVGESKITCDPEKPCCKHY